GVVLAQVEDDPAVRPLAVRGMLLLLAAARRGPLVFRGRGGAALGGAARDRQGRDQQAQAQQLRVLHLAFLSRETNTLPVLHRYASAGSNSSSDPPLRASRSASLPENFQNNPGWSRNSQNVEVTRPPRITVATG